MNSNRILILVYTSIFLSGCGGDPEFERKDEEWRSEVNSFSDQPRTAAEVEQWLLGHGVDWSHDHLGDQGEGYHTHAADLQILHDSKKILCTWRTTSLRFVHVDDGDIDKFSVYDAGDCLW